MRCSGDGLFGLGFGGRRVGLRGRATTCREALFYPQRGEDHQVIEIDERLAAMLGAIGENPQYPCERIEYAYRQRADDGAAGMHEGLQRDGDEGQGKGEYETHAHLGGSGDPTIANRAGGRLAVGEQVGDQCRIVLREQVAHIGESGLDAGEGQQDAERHPDHAPAHLVVQGPDRGEQPGNAQRLHQEQSHGRFHQYDHQGGDIGGLETQQIAAAADHLLHRPGDQIEVDHRAADGDNQYEGGDEELGEG